MFINLTGVNVLYVNSLLASAKSAQLSCTIYIKRDEREGRANFKKKKSYKICIYWEERKKCGGCVPVAKSKAQ